MMSDTKFIATFLGACVLIIAVSVSVLLFSLRAYGRNQCSNWGHDAGYTTKYIVPGFVDTGTCLAKTRDGYWVKNTDIITIRR